MNQNREPDKVVRAGGREFLLYKEYDDFTGQNILIYPDFAAAPEYTAEGRPFTTAAEESCPHGKPSDPKEDDPGDCGGCVYFRREQTPLDIIGVCMCEALRRN